ncbi:hypothetical protein MC377_08945 [Salmonella enterica]|nr:hypothetical protein [Salmonella enterica]ULA44357.1 hypothetical protein MC377_08945 [Salmonella enterica]UNN22194.1 hypothetical protein MOV21_08950 [Salmonella enterica]
MSDIYQITPITQTGETFTGKMSRRQPELVNGFVPLATETLTAKIADILARECYPYFMNGHNRATRL